MPCFRSNASRPKKNSKSNAEIRMLRVAVHARARMQVQNLAPCRSHTEILRTMVTKVGGSDDLGRGHMLSPHRSSRPRVNKK